MKRIRNIFGALGLFLMLLWSGPTFASHAAGADVTWTCNPSNPCLITFTYTFYRDCGGIAYGNPVPLNFGGCTVAPVAQNNWTGGLVGEITPVCNNQTTNCAGGSFPGIQQYQHQITYDFCANGTPCANYNVFWSLSARNAGITSLSNSAGQAMGTSFTVPINPRNCNSSPTFNTPPILYICDGQPNVFSQGASDPDGNTLSYSMIGCMQNANTSVNYAANYSPTAPLGPNWTVGINQNTGNITFTPNPGGLLTAVVCVQVDELDGNGNVIGNVVRDIQVRVVNCNNNLPTLSGPFHYDACIGDQICLNITSADQDAGDVLTVTEISNNTGVPMTIGGSPNPTASMCWTPSNAGTYTIVLEVRDDACPLNGVQQYTYTIDVRSCDPCDAITIIPSFTHSEGLLSTTVTNTSVVTPLGLGPIFTHFKWGDGNVTTYSGNYTTPVGHTYAAPGTYNVCVVIEAFVGNVCCHDSICMPIVITDDPCDFHEAHFTAVGLISPPCTYRFYDNSTPGSTTVYWDFGDGSPVATGSPVQHTFPNGTWTITMTSIYYPPGHPELCCVDVYRETYRINCGIIHGGGDTKKVTSLVAYNGQDGNLNVLPSEEIVLNEEATLSIYDMSGKLLHNQTLPNRNSYQVNLSGYANGVYLVRISGNGLVETTKIMKY